MKMQNQQMKVNYKGRVPINRIRNNVRVTLGLRKVMIILVALVQMSWAAEVNFTLMLRKDKKLSTNYELRSITSISPEEEGERTLFRFNGTSKFSFARGSRSSTLFRFSLDRLKSYKSCSKTGLMCVLLKIKKPGFKLSRAANRWLLLDAEGKTFLRYCFGQINAIGQRKYSNISQVVSKLLPSSSLKLTEKDSEKIERNYTVKMRKYSNTGSSWSYEIRNIGIHPNYANDEKYPFKFLGRWQMWSKGQKRGSATFKFKLHSVKEIKESKRTGLWKALLKLKRGGKGSYFQRACNRWIILDKEGSDFMRFCLEQKLFEDAAPGRTLGLEDKLMEKEFTPSGEFKHKENKLEVFRFNCTNTSWLVRDGECFGIDGKKGMEGLLSSAAQHTAIPRVDEDKSLILLTGACHYLFAGMTTVGEDNMFKIPLDSAVVTPKQPEQLHMKTTLGELIAMVEKVDEAIFKKKWTKEGTFTQDRQTKAWTLKGEETIVQRRNKVIRFLRSLSHNMQTKIVVVREVLDFRWNEAKPAWAATLTKELTENGEQCEIILDIGTGKMAPTFPSGNQDDDLYAKYDEKMDVDKVTLTKGRHEHENITITFADYVEMLAKKHKMVSMVARYTGGFRHKVKGAMAKRKDVFQQCLRAKGVEPQVLAIEQEGYYGSKHMLEIATPFIEKTDIEHVLILESGSGSFQGARYTRLNAPKVKQDVEEEKSQPEHGVVCTSTTRMVTPRRKRKSTLKNIQPLDLNIGSTIVTNVKLNNQEVPATSPRSSTGLQDPSNANDVDGQNNIPPMERRGAFSNPPGSQKSSSLIGAAVVPKHTLNGQLSSTNSATSAKQNHTPPPPPPAPPVQEVDGTVANGLKVDPTSTKASGPPANKLSTTVTKETPAAAPTMETLEAKFQLDEKVVVGAGKKGWLPATIIKGSNSKGEYKIKFTQCGSEYRCLPNLIQHTDSRRRLASRLENRPIHMLAKLIQQAQA